MLYFVDSVNFISLLNDQQGPDTKQACFKIQVAVWHSLLWRKKIDFSWQMIIVCWKTLIQIAGIHWHTMIINLHLLIYSLLGLIMIQLFKFLPNNMKKFMFLDKTDISTFADQSFHFYSKFLLMSSYSHPSKKTKSILCKISQSTQGIIISQLRIIFKYILRYESPNVITDFIINILGAGYMKILRWLMQACNSITCQQMGLF